MGSRGDHSTAGRAASAVLLALVAVEAYGLVNGHLWSQEIWYPAGIERFRFFLGLFVGVATPVVVLAPWALAPLAALLVATGTIFAVGWAAALAPVLFIASSWSLGRLLLRGKSIPLATLLGAGVYVLLMTLTARLPIHYPWVWLVVLLGGAGWYPARRLATGAGGLPTRRRLTTCPTTADYLALALLIFILLMHWLVVLKPEAGADGLAAHLAVASNIAAHHAYTVDPGRLLWAVMPMGADWTYSIVYLLGGELAARLLNFAWFLLLLALLYGVARRWLPRAPALLLVAVFAATPLAQLVTGELFVENFQAALLLGMVVALSAGEPLWLAAALAGTALATKIGSLAFVAVALPFAFRRPRRALAALVLLAAAAPTYLIAWRLTGNPLYPYFNRRFHSPLLPAAADVSDYRFHELLRWSTLYDLTFHTSRYYEGQDGSFGFQFLVLIPLAVGIGLAARRARILAVAGAGGMLLILLSTPNVRYLYAALPMLAAASAAALAWLSKNQPRTYRAALAYLLLCVAANIWFLPSSSWYHKGFYLPNTVSAVSAARDVAVHFRRGHPHENVLLIGDMDQADLAADAHEFDWHEPVLNDAIHRALDMSAMARLMEQWKIRYAIARRTPNGDWLRPPALRELLTWCSATEYEFENYYLARLDSSCVDHSASTRPLITVGPGTYDDFDAALRYRGDWDHRDDFNGPHLHSISYTDVAGAEVALAFQGTALTVVFTKAPNRGIVEIWIDGVLRASINAYSPRIEWQSRLRVCCLAPGRHEASIRATGRKQAAAQGAFVDVDAMIVE
ncbi:MAG TPA: hypothetical protein VLW65_00465 [Bryobacteraceae bacterium]|nr:hypothetical protein [Bryobacteraceae bacterium]